MGHVPSAEKTPLTLEEVVAMTLVEMAGLSEFDQRGSSAYLMYGNDRREVSYKMHIARVIRPLVERLLVVESQAVLGSLPSYNWTYNEVSATPTILPFSLKSVSPVPTEVDRVIMWRNGQLLPAYAGWALGATAFVLSYPLTAGERVEVVILTPALARTHKGFAYKGASGTGVGHRVFTLADLGEDIYRQTIQAPDTSDKLWVHQNGQKRLLGVDYTYAAGVVTFLLDISADEDISFVCWRA
jgi:hypothetical protein